MESDGTERKEQGNSTTTNRPPSLAVDGERNSRVNPQVGETRSPRSLEKYENESQKKMSAGGNPDPRNNLNYISLAAQRSAVIYENTLPGSPLRRL